MKNVLMTLLFLSGFAATGIDAQVCCTPCPPACCVKTCTPEQQKNCTPEQMKNCKPTQQTASTSEQVKASGILTTTSAKPTTACCAAAKTAPKTSEVKLVAAEAKPAETPAVLVKNDEQ